MFTGLVEATGIVTALETLGNQARLTLELPFAAELESGESVAVNGCCLTVAERSASGTSFDLLSQTLRVTSLGGLSEGSTVNLERALKANDRLGGHFVQGHVDATGSILRLDPDGQDHVLEISLPPQIHALCIDKGSLTIDGISLTIAGLGENSATFWITPHTFAHTHLHRARPGQTVNLEADVLAKYVEKLLSARLAKS